MLNMTTLARVKQLLTGLDSADAGDDRAIKQLIFSVSDEIEEALDRLVLKESQTEYFDVRPGQEVFSLKAYPVDTDQAFAVKNAEDRDFAAASAIDSADYDILAGKNEGLLTVDKYTLSHGAGALQVVYTGGMATVTSRMTCVVASASGFSVADTVTGGTSGAEGTVVSISGTTMVIDVLLGRFIATETITGSSASPPSTTITSISVIPFVMAYADLTLACEQEVGFRYQRRAQMGVTSVSVEGGSVSFTRGEFLPSVAGIIRRHRRWVV